MRHQGCSPLSAVLHLCDPYLHDLSWAECESVYLCPGQEEYWEDKDKVGKRSSHGTLCWDLMARS